MKKTILLLTLTTALTTFGAQPTQFHLGFEGVPLGDSAVEAAPGIKVEKRHYHNGPLPGTNVETSDINLISINDGEQQFVELTGNLKIPLKLQPGRYTLRFSWKPHTDGYPGRQQGFAVKINGRCVFYPFVKAPFNGNKSNNAELTIDLTGDDELRFAGEPCGNMGTYLDSIWLAPAPKGAELSPEVSQKVILTDNP